MTVQLQLKIKNKRSVERFFRRFPDKAGDALTKGIHKSIFILHKESQKGNSRDDPFNFKNPTGRLQKSFSQGMKFGKLYGSIGPTVHYAANVYFGTKNIKTKQWNVGGKTVRAYQPYLDRIVHNAEPEVNREINREIGGAIKKAVK